MPLYTHENNRLPTTSRASPRHKFVNDFDQRDAEPYIRDSFDDTLQAVEDLWRPPYTVKPSIPSHKMPSRPDSGVLPRVDVGDLPPSYSERPIQSPMSRVNGVSASPKGIVRAERSESRASESPTDRMSESGGSSYSRASTDSTETPVQIARRAPPARRPLPPSKRSSASSVMGTKSSKLDAVNRDSSGSVSAQQSRILSLPASRDPTPASSAATITSLDYTPSGSSSLREEFQRRIPDSTISREQQISSVPNTPSVLARSHSRDKSNTALHILNSFPMVKNSNRKSTDASNQSPSSSAHPPPPSPPAVPPHTNPWTSTAVPPLTLAHHHCYQSHRTMRLSRNVYAPVPCMTCYREDKEPRWLCSWCCLRICRQCQEVLENSGERTVSDILSNVRTKAAYVEGSAGWVSAPRRSSSMWPILNRLQI